jgi:hypothetical protein
MERELHYGIYSEKLLGLRMHCDERGCTGWTESTGFLRFSWRGAIASAWSIEYVCATCGTIENWHERERIPLVREVLRPIFQDPR